MSAGHFTHNPNGSLVMGVDVNSEPRITFSLESLPVLLSARDLRLLKVALRNALPDGQDIAKGDDESEGDYLARLIGAAAQVSLVRRVV